MRRTSMWWKWAMALCRCRGMYKTPSRKGDMNGFQMIAEKEWFCIMQKKL